MKNNSGFVTTRGERLSYWSYFIGQNMFYTIVTTYLTTYTMFLGIDLARLAAVMLAVKVWDAVNDPLFGVIFDKIKFKKGKSLPWLRISLLLIPAATIFMFMIPAASSDTVKLIWFGIAYLLWDTAYTVCDVPIYSMVTTMTDNLGERNTLMSTGRIFSAVGTGIAAIMCTLLVSETVGLGFGPISIMLSVIAVLFMLPICIKGRERNYRTEEAEESFTIRQMLKYLVHNKYLLIYYGGNIISGIAVTNTAVSMFVSYYLFGSANFNLILSLLSAIPAGLAALVLPRILKKVDKFKLLFVCTVINTVFGFVIYAIGWGKPTIFIALSIARAVFAGITGILAFMFTPDCAEYGRFKTGIDAKGITFAIQTFTAKITAAVASSLGVFVLGLFKWNEVNASSFAEIEALNITQPESALTGLWVTYALIPAIGLALSIVFYLFYKLNDRDVQIMAKCNAGEITREDAEAQLSRKY